MKTHLVTLEGCELDSCAARLGMFRYCANNFGDEWTRDYLESVSPREVWYSEPEEDATPWIVSYKSGFDSSETVARFATEEEAVGFAASENQRIKREYVNGPGFFLLALPEGWQPEFGSVQGGQYPQSRKALCWMSRKNADGTTTTAEGYAYWNAQGVTDKWPRLEAIHSKLVDLIDGVVATAVGTPS